MLCACLAGKLCCVLGLCIEAVGKKHFMAWCPAWDSATLREQGRVLLVTLQCDRFSLIHRGLQFVDIFGHNIKCDICEICSIMLSPMIVYGFHFL